MMGYLFFVIFVFATAAAVPQEMKQGKEKNYTAISEECQKESGFDGSYTNLTRGQEPKTYKCYLACILKKDGVMKEDGMLDLTTAKTLIHENSKLMKDGMKEKALKITEDCFAETAEMSIGDECEKAYNLYLCEVKRGSESQENEKKN